LQEIKISESSSTAWWLLAFLPSSGFSLPCSRPPVWSALLHGDAERYAACMPSLSANLKFAISL
jgi:hypothetical protein